MVVAEAMEVLGGNGYVEESALPRLYREAPLNSIWEGSGNIMCLDVLRAARREPDAVAALLAELALARGGDARLDRHVARLSATLADGALDEAGARRLAGDIALALAAALLVRTRRAGGRRRVLRVAPGRKLRGRAGDAAGGHRLRRRPRPGERLTKENADAADRIGVVERLLRAGVSWSARPVSFRPWPACPAIPDACRFRRRPAAASSDTALAAPRRRAARGPIPSAARRGAPGPAGRSGATDRRLGVFVQQQRRFGEKHFGQHGKKFRRALRRVRIDRGVLAGLDPRPEVLVRDIHRLLPDRAAAFRPAAEGSRWPRRCACRACARIRG